MKCLGCGSPDPGDKWKRGLCSRCYQRAFAVGLHIAYPACGRRPVPYRVFAYAGPREPVYAERARERNWQREIERVERFERYGWRGQRKERVA